MLPTPVKSARSDAGGGAVAEAAPLADRDACVIPEVPAKSITPSNALTLSSVDQDGVVAAMSDASGLVSLICAERVLVTVAGAASRLSNLTLPVTIPAREKATLLRVPRTGSNSGTLTEPTQFVVVGAMVSV